MATNGAQHRKGSAQDEVTEDAGSNYLQQIKTSGGMTITPELFEKVKFQLLQSISIQLPVSD
jgi:hypothetical protein